MTSALPTSKVWLLLDLHARPPLWIADERMLDVGGCEHHVDQLILVFRAMAMIFGIHLR